MSYAKHSKHSFKGPIIRELLERERGEMRSIEANRPKCEGCKLQHRGPGRYCWGCQQDQNERTRRN